MAKRVKNEAQNVPLEFPTFGLEEVRAYTRQRPGTTAQAFNVRAFEPGTDRARGGSRAGLTKYLAAQVNGSNSIQCVDVIKTSTTVPPQLYSQFCYAKAIGAGFGIANDFNGSSLFSGLGAVTGYQFANSCWDTLGNLYVAEINVGAGLFRVYCFSPIGAMIWTSNTFGVAKIARGVAGMAVVGSNLFVAVIRAAPSGFVYVASACYILQINIASAGNGVPGVIWQTSNSGFLNFSVNAGNCLGFIGTTLGVETCQPAGFYTFNATLAASTAQLSFTAWTGTINASVSKVVSDGTANFYGIASVLTSQIFKVTLGGSLTWTSAAADPANSIAYDLSINALVAVCQIAPSVRQINIATGALIANVGPLTTVYSEIGADNLGFFVLWENSVASNDVFGLNQSLNTRFGPSTLANALHTGASVNPSGPVTVAPTGPRDIMGVAIAGGTAKTFTKFGLSSISNGSVFSSAQATISSAVLGQNVYFTDGTGYFFYNSNTRAIAPWVASTGGTMPVDTPGTGPAQLLVAWRGRIVFYGFRNNPHIYYMSAQFDPFNLDTAPFTLTATQAEAGDQDFAGQSGQFINCCIPYDDNTLIFGLAHEIWQLSGDPAAGGQANVVSRNIGMAWDAPWTIDGYGQIYFMSNGNGIFKMTPGALPVRISMSIEREIQNISLTMNRVRLEWDTLNHGLWMWVTPYNKSLPSLNYFWEERTNAWWHDFYASNLMNPLAVRAYRGDGPADQVIFLGGRDGYVRVISNPAASDDGTPIQSSVMLGPIPNKTYERQILLDMLATLSDTSGPVTYSVFVGETPSAALASEPVCTGTWVAGRNPVSFSRWSGLAIYIQISATNPWAMEYVMARVAMMGMEASRMYMGQPAIASPGVSPTAPTGLTATAGTNQVSLAFNLVTGATSYNLYRGVAAGNEFPYPIATGITSSPYVDSTVFAGTTYFYCLTAVNAFGESPPSNEAS